MSIFDGWFGRRKVKLTEPETWNFDGGSHAGKSVTPDSALSLATAWSCVRLLSETIATLPLGIYRKDAKGAKAPAGDHALYALLHDSPNADQSAAEFWEGQVASLCLWGNGYAEKLTGANGRLISLEPMRSDLVSVFRDANGRRKYRYNDPRSPREPLDEDQVFHLRGFGVGGDVGLSPISYARETMGTALAAEEAAGRFFANGMQVSGFVEMMAKMDTEQTNQMLALFDKFTGSPRAGKVMPLPHGAKFVPLTMNPDDAELLQTRAFHVEEICRWFRVPPFMVGHTEKTTSWGTGLEQQMIGFLTFSLRPYLTRIEQAVKKQLIAPAERASVYAEFNLEGLMRADSAGRAALYSSASQNGWMRRGEIRALENLPPPDGPDPLTVQSNLVPLAQLGQQPARAVQPAPGEPV